MLTIRWADVEGLKRFEAGIRALGDRKMRAVGNRAVNRTGDMARTQVRRALTKQTGLKRRVIVEAVKVTRSTPATLIYRMSAAGGDISLKHFAARETRRGVSAAPFGKRKIFAHTFIKGGLFPDRKTLAYGGEVFMPDLASSDWGRTFEVQKSGVVIPAEMVKGETKAAFERTVATVLPARLEHELHRATGGIFR